MKKLLILVLCLLWSGSAYAKLIEFNKCHNVRYASFEEFKNKINSYEDRIITIDTSANQVTATMIRTQEQADERTKITKELGAGATNKIDQQIYQITTFSAGIVSAQRREKNNGLISETKIFINLEQANYDYQFKIYDGSKIRFESEYSLKCYKNNNNADEGASGSSGTAFFINSKGYLLTNNHVVEGCKLQQVKYNDKDYEAKIIATDKTLDLAIILAS